MVRHVDPSDDSFRRSLLRAAAGGLVAMVVTFGITAVLASVGRNDDAGSPAVTTPTAAPEQTVAFSEPLATDAEATQTPVEETEAATEVPDDPSTVTVQVLDTVGTGQGAAALEAAEVLRELGYDVVAVNSTPRTVESTTVLASAGYLDEAEALRDQDDRFGEVGANDGFTEEVDMHVLVAEDFGE